MSETYDESLVLRDLVYRPLPKSEPLDLEKLIRTIVREEMKELTKQFRLPSAPLRQGKPLPFDMEEGE